MPVRVDWSGGAGISAVAYSRAIDALWAPGLEIHLYSENLARDVRRVARGNAPVRTRTLWRGIEVQYARSANIRSVTHHVVSKARHSLWVHEGTNGQVAHGNRFFLPAGGPGLLGRTTSPYRGKKFKARRLRKVRGQRANPFLSDALNTVWARQVPRGALSSRFAGAVPGVFPVRPRRR